MNGIRSRRRRIDQHLLDVIHMVAGRVAYCVVGRIGGIQRPRIMRTAGTRHPKVEIVHEHGSGDVHAASVCSALWVGPNNGRLQRLAAVGNEVLGPL